MLIDIYPVRSCRSVTLSGAAGCKTGPFKVMFPSRNPQSAGRRGRGARTPVDIPKRGWCDILLHTKDQIAADNADDDPTVSLTHRAMPLIDLFKAAEQGESDVLWKSN